jgi:hypothetical protein
LNTNDTLEEFPVGRLLGSNEYPFVPYQLELVTAGVLLVKLYK